MNNLYLPVLVGLVGLLAFVGFWCLLLVVLSTVSGWRRLARSFATRRLPAGRAFGWQSARVGWVSYNSCLRLHAAADGLFIQPLLPFRLAHRLLFIPWSELRDGQRRRLLGVDFTHFVLARPAGFRLALPSRVVEGRG